jgi:hypothetical protein
MIQSVVATTSGDDLEDSRKMAILLGHAISLPSTDPQTEYPCHSGIIPEKSKNKEPVAPKNTYQVFVFLIMRSSM